MTAALAILYAGAACLPLAMQVALVLGAPLGRFTMGGRWPGPLPMRLRPVAALAGLLLALLIAVVLDHAGLADLGFPDWAVWPALALTLLTTVLNLATPSRPERLLWGPVTLTMSAALLALIIL